MRSTNPLNVANLKRLVFRTFEAIILDVWRQLRWSFLPPLLIYFAAGVSGITAIVGTFYIKESLGLSAAFLAGLTFWAGLPWALKMPVGHLVDLIWRRKALLVYLGAALISASLLIMYLLIAQTERMSQIMSVEAWFVLSALLAPVGYVTQDAVADAMTVEAVPQHDERGQPYSDAEIKAMHTTVQTLGRVVLISGFVIVASLNIFIFSNVGSLQSDDKTSVYASVYLLAFVIPCLSISGVALSAYIQSRRATELRNIGLSEQVIQQQVYEVGDPIKPNYWILGGSAMFIAWTLLLGLAKVPFSQEIALLGSMAIIIFLISRLIRELDSNQARMLVGTAIIIFVFRSVPLPGAAALWFEIDQLGFDQQFFAILSLITSCVALIGMMLLRPLMATRSIAYIVVLLSIMAGLMSLPNIGLYYGLHNWTSSWSGGIVDARFIAIMDTTIESPLGQIAMIPMLAWIAKNAPSNLKATFFSIMASFTNLALSTSSLLTKYLNEIFVVSRQVTNSKTGAIEIAADYSQLGYLLIVVSIIAVAVPLATIFIVQMSKYRTQE